MLNITNRFTVEWILIFSTGQHPGEAMPEALFRSHQGLTTLSSYTLMALYSFIFLVLIIFLLQIEIHV